MSSWINVGISVIGVIMIPVAVFFYGHFNSRINTHEKLGAHASAGERIATVETQIDSLTTLVSQLDENSRDRDNQTVTHVTQVVTTKLEVIEAKLGGLEKSIAKLEASLRERR